MISPMKSRLYLVFFCAFLCAVLFVSCGSGTPATASGAGGAESGGKAVFKPRHRTADHKVVALVGSDFASRPEILDGLIAEYGLDGSGGMVIRMQYPDAFLDGKRVKLSALADAIESSGATTLVTLGAPEGIATALSIVRNRTPGVRIANLFASDDMLPVEAVSDIALEFVPPGGILTDEDATAMPQDGVDVLVLAAVLAVEDPDASISPLLRMQTAFDAARTYLRKKDVGSDWKIDAWTDPDTNLRSRVRLVLSSGSSGGI
jgi:hypothetical protein